jgi:hypothetical protein
MFGSQPNILAIVIRASRHLILWIDGGTGGRTAALMVSKLHKIGERENTPTRLVNKDAHDLYRIRVPSAPMSLWLRLSGSCTTTGVEDNRTGAGLPRAPVLIWT